jgi:hypothetical protein
MFFLTGTAAASALDLIAKLQQTVGAKKPSGAQAPVTGFDSSTAATTDAGSPSAGDSASAPNSLLAPDTLDALLAVQGQNQPAIVNGDAFSKQLFSLLDSDGNGSISKSEFETAFGQNGNNTLADQIFGKLDANGDGSVTQAELTNALNGQGQSQQVPHHHHHHFGGMGGLGASASGGANGATDPLAALGGNSQTVNNSDGSTTTTITYADGSTVSMTMPAASGSGAGSTGNGGNNGAAAHNFIERMIQRQAQLLGGASAGQAVAVSA